MQLVKIVRNIKKWLWTFLSFILPLCLYHLLMNASPFISLRAGFVGLLLACTIYTLWKVSIRFYGNVLPERYSGLFIMLSGISLWIIWFIAVQVILIAYDEAMVVN